jgi:hypothetical protein
MFKARLYFDFDGVVNAKEPTHKSIKSFQIPIEGSDHLAPVNHITYSPTVVTMIEVFREKYGLELVWGSTWNEFSHVLKLAAHLEGLDNGRVLPAALNKAAKDKAEWTAWKAAAIIADQAQDPLPFIWVDDNAHRYHGELVQNNTTAEGLLLTPNSLTGLTLEDLDTMESFLRTLTQA